jgi:hypothetical protein
MVKIETVVRISEQFPAGKSSEYIWLQGQPWPVPKEEDHFLLRIEAFGPEMEWMKERLSRSTVATDHLMVWYRSDAAYVSEQMRTFWPKAVVSL